MKHGARLGGDLRSKNALHLGSPGRRVWLLGLAVFGAASFAPAQTNYELGIAAKQTEIQWKQADLQAAQREVAILSQFLGGYDTKMTDLASARSQLASAHSQLASIQQGNLVKLTIRMGIETYSTVSDTINLGKTAATALVTRGVTSAVGEVAMDQLTSALGDQAKAAIGMDDETLGGPRTVKVRAVSAAARAAFPELGRVQQSLALSLEAVKIAARQEDGTELGDTGALLRKNIMVRDEITAAIAKLENVGTEAAAAKAESETHLTQAEADVTRLTAELNALQLELDTLKSQWRQAEDAERAAANAAAYVPPVRQPRPNVSLTKGETETDWEFQQRINAAILAAAQARWNNEASPLLSSIATRKTQIETAQTAIVTAVTSTVDTPEVPGFIRSFSSSDQVPAEVTASYESAVSNYAYIDTWVNAVTPAESALPGLLTQIDGLTDQYTSLVNLQAQLQSLRQLLVECGGGTPESFYVGIAGVGMGQEAAESLGVSLDQYLKQLPKALANARVQLDQLAAAAASWSAGIGAVRTDLDSNLAAAEAALAELVNRAAAWNSALVAAAGLTVDSASGPAECRLGYFNGNTFVPVLRHAFSLGVYQQSLHQALVITGAPGLAAARVLRANYDALVAAAPALKDAYDAAWQRFTSAYGRVRSYYSGYSFPVYDDWQRAAAYSSTRNPVNASGVSNQVTRFQSLYNTLHSQHLTSVGGGAPVVGQPVLVWGGLTRLRQLPDPGLDDPPAYLPHRMIAAKAVIVEQGPTWIPLAPQGFNARLNDIWNEIWSIHERAQQISEESKGVAESLLREVGAVQNAYVAAHPAPVITTPPAGGRHDIPAGTTYTGQLTVAVTGDFPSYQWSVTRWTTDEFGWEDIAGATAATLTTPALSETRWFRVTVTNPGGTVTSAPAKIEVYQVYPPPEFTSAASASGQVDVPFSWQFTTTPAGWIMVGHQVTLPPGLTFNYMTSRLEGTPLQAGTWELEIMASNQGTFASQTFRLTIAPGTPAIPVISSARTATAVTGAPFTYQITASGSPTSFAASGLPAWLTLTPATGILSGTPSAAGTHAIALTASNVLGTSPAVTLTLTVGAPPQIVTAPLAQAVAAGGTLRLAVVVTGTAPFTYEWRRYGTLLANDARISGATTAVLTVTGFQESDAGVYSVTVSNGIGAPATPAGANVTLAPAGLAATHARTESAGYLPGGTVTITNTVTFSGAVSRVRWSVLPPAGWTLQSMVNTGAPAAVPALGAGSLLEWDWTTPPASPATFTYTLAVPANARGDQPVVALAEVTVGGVPVQIVARPDPLVIVSAAPHSADTNGDWKISLFELTRVIELFNTRNGASRTGCYRVDAGGEDGFNPEPTRAAGVVAALACHHSADTSRDGKLSLFELTRVIELFNHRAGASRTGQYHLAPGTEDGFAPGP
jgi:hypothetical protein